MNGTKRKPKATDVIRRRLQYYHNLQIRIDNTEKRIACLDMSMGAPSTTNVTGMPGGSGDGSSKQERDYIKKEELREKLADMYAEENTLREEIEDMIERMENPDEQTVIEMRYLDGVGWRKIAVALFSEEPDYDENEERYRKRTYRLHDAALLTLYRICKENRG